MSPMPGFLIVILMERVTRNFANAKHWGRNAKVFVLTEVAWGIPFSWFFFYQAIFMRSLGMSEVFIGFSMMLLLILQIFLPILGGSLADKFGRKRVLVVFDTVGWIGAMVMWLVAREPWQIVVAILFQGLTATILGVWETLLVEDTEPAYRAGIYSFIQAIYIFGGILTPIAGAAIFLYGIEQGCRYLFLTALLVTAAVSTIYQIYLRESKIGKILSSSEEESPKASGGYTQTLKTVTRHRKLLMLSGLTIIGAIQNPLVNTYKPLYLTDSKALALDEGVISIIPMASSISSLIALSFIVPRLKNGHIEKALLFSYVCGFFGLITLVMAPRGSLVLAILSGILDSARVIAVTSILRVFFANAIDEANPFARAKIMSLITTFSALVSWPAPLLGGYLYAVSPTLPFVLAATFLVLSISLTLKI